MSEWKCIEWMGTINPDGYGRTTDGRYAHRVAYEEAKGQIPEGLQIDHLCRNRRCVNAAHLEAVTLQENRRRGAAAQTHCKHGHPFGPATDYHRPDRGGVRECGVCRKARNRARGRKASHV